MKATGIVRRIDELGRVVIPKEIRRTLRIRVGDPLEIFTDKDGQIIFKKYSHIEDLTDVASTFSSVLSSSLDAVCLVTDKDNIVAVSGAKTREFMEKEISRELLRSISGREGVLLHDSNKVKITENDDPGKYKTQIIVPILVDGDVTGAIIAISRKEAMDEKELLVCKTLAKLIGCQIEC